MYMNMYAYCTAQYHRICNHISHIEMNIIILKIKLGVSGSRIADTIGHYHYSMGNRNIDRSFGFVSFVSGWKSCLIGGMME